jgi:hypothetical protein
MGTGAQTEKARHWPGFFLKNLFRSVHFASLAI